VPVRARSLQQLGGVQHHPLAIFGVQALLPSLPRNRRAGLVAEQLVVSFGG
jgi:hypothetical protein